MAAIRGSRLGPRMASRQHRQRRQRRAILQRRFVHDGGPRLSAGRRSGPHQVERRRDDRPDGLLVGRLGRRSVVPAIRPNQSRRPRPLSRPPARPTSLTAWRCVGSPEPTLTASPHWPHPATNTRAVSAAQSACRSRRRPASAWASCAPHLDARPSARCDQIRRTPHAVFAGPATNAYATTSASWPTATDTTTPGPTTSANAPAPAALPPRAGRIFGRAWTRIVWRCWQDHVPYNPTDTEQRAPSERRIDTGRLACGRRLEPRVGRVVSARPAARERHAARRRACAAEAGGVSGPARPSGGGGARRAARPRPRATTATRPAT